MTLSGTNRSTGSITLEDVAKLAGVSPITVSRVINHPEKVAQLTIDKVQQAIERTGYVPNMLAGGLASSRSMLVAAIVPSIENSIFAETIQHFSDRLWEAGYQVLLGVSGYPAIREDALLSAILSRRPDAIFLTGIEHSAESRRKLLAAKIPLVETWDLTPSPLDIIVGFSHSKVGQAVADYLVGRGYRNIGMVTADDQRAAVRRHGFLSALAKHGINDVPVSTVSAPTNLSQGRSALSKLLDEGFGSGAIFCSSDILAQGVLAEAQSRSLSIPGELAIMGFADQKFAAHTFPSLSTVRIDRVAIGRKAAESLLARINGQAGMEKVVDVGFEIIERSTT
jgi:LacI family gluconate utilization system Gnt-I transcriptional repressor